MLRKGILLLLAVLPATVFGKGEQRLLVELSIGITSGWWVYNKGSLDGTEKTNLGWDHTRTAPFEHLNGILIYQHSKWKIGGGTCLSVLFEDEMLGSENSSRKYDKYPIADRYPLFWQFYMMTEYDIFSRKRYALSPHLKCGSFMVNTTHPEADNFGFRYFFEAGVNNEIKMKNNLFLMLMPCYKTMTIFPKEKKADKERHHISNFGVQVGLRYSLFNKNVK